MELRRTLGEALGVLEIDPNLHEAKRTIARLRIPGRFTDATMHGNFLFGEMC